MVQVITRRTDVTVRVDVNGCLVQGIHHVKIVIIVLSLTVQLDVNRVVWMDPVFNVVSVVRRLAEMTTTTTAILAAATATVLVLAAVIPMITTSIFRLMYKHMLTV